MLHPLVEDLQLILEQFERDLIGMTKKDALTMLKEKIDEFFKVIELTETEEKIELLKPNLEEKLDNLRKECHRKFDSNQEFWKAYCKEAAKIAEEHFKKEERDVEANKTIDEPEVKLEKWTERYLIVCPSCGGSGMINNPQPVISTAQIICPACQGSKTVFVVKENLESQ